MKIIDDSYVTTIFKAFLTFFSLTFLLLYIFIFSYFSNLRLWQYTHKTNVAAGLLNQLWVPKVSSAVQVNFIVFVEYSFCFKLYFHLLPQNAI